MPDRLSKDDRKNLREFAAGKRSPITIAEARGTLAMMAQDLLDVDRRRADIEKAAEAMMAAVEFFTFCVGRGCDCRLCLAITAYKRVSE